MRIIEPSLSPATPQAVVERPSFVIGQDEAGQWIAPKVHGWRGGFFRSREAALHCASAETEHRLGAVELTAEPIRLPM